MLLRLSYRSFLLRKVPAGRVSFSASAASPAMAVGSAVEGDGRRRRERKEQPVAHGIEGTAEYYTRQLVVVDPESSAPVNWPKKLEFSDHVVSAYVKAIASIEHPKHCALRTIAATPFPVACTSTLTSDAPEATEPAHDLLIFPDQLRVKNVQLAHIPSLVTQLLQPTPDVQSILASESLEYAPLADGYHVLVCAHEQRDERCGCKGPELLRWLQDVAHKKNVPLQLYSSSHFGGHRYAANCIVYPTGDWYGLLNEPADAKSLVDALEDGQPLRLASQWRGRIATTKEQQIEMLQAALTKS